MWLKSFILAAILIAWTELFAMSAAAQVGNYPKNFYECRDHFPGSRPIAKARDNQVELCYAGMASLYDVARKRPVFVSAYIDPMLLKNSAERNKDRAQIEFFADSRVPKMARPEDYLKTGYDRGHLIANSFSVSASMQLESFSTANICPQNPHSNRDGGWRMAEKATKAYIERGNAVYLVAGCTGDVRTIKGGIAVPSHFWLAVFSDSGKSWGYWVENTATDAPAKPITIGELESRLGFNLTNK